MKLPVQKLFLIALAFLCILLCASCGSTTPVDTLPIGVITRPPETDAPEPTTPVHKHEWVEEMVYTAYERPNENGEVGYFSYPCAVEDCPEIKDDLIAPVLHYLTFDGEGTLHEYLDATEGVAPLFKNETSFSTGTLQGGAYYADGLRNEQVFIVSEHMLDEVETFTVSMDVVMGEPSKAGSDTFFGFGRTSASQASVYYFQLRLENGEIHYLDNFTDVFLQSQEFSGHKFELGRWYHFEIEINMANQTVSVRAGEWLDEARTQLSEMEWIGSCEGMHKKMVELDTVVFRISASNGLAAMDNFIVTLPER